MVKLVLAEVAWVVTTRGPVIRQSGWHSVTSYGVGADVTSLPKQLNLRVRTYKYLSVPYAENL